MQVIPVENIDMQLSEIDGLVRALIFIQEEAEPAQRDELRGSTVAMLYVIADKLRAANGSVAVIHRHAASATVN